MIELPPWGMYAIFYGVLLVVLVLVFFLGAWVQSRADVPRCVSSLWSDVTYEGEELDKDGKIKKYGECKAKDDFRGRRRRY